MSTMGSRWKLAFNSRFELSGIVKDVSKAICVQFEGMFPPLPKKPGVRLGIFTNLDFVSVVTKQGLILEYRPWNVDKLGLCKFEENWSTSGDRNCHDKVGLSVRYGCTFYERLRTFQGICVSSTDNWAPSLWDAPRRIGFEDILKKALWRVLCGEKREGIYTEPQRGYFGIWNGLRASSTINAESWRGELQNE